MSFTRCFLGSRSEPAAGDEHALRRALAVQGADELSDLANVCASVPGPQLANLSHASGRTQPALSAIATSGAAAVMFPSAALFAAAGAVTRALTALRNDGRFAATEPDFITADAYNTVVDLAAFIARER